MQAKKQQSPLTTFKEIPEEDKDTIDEGLNEEGESLEGPKVEQPQPTEDEATVERLRRTASFSSVSRFKPSAKACIDALSTSPLGMTGGGVAPARNEARLAAVVLRGPLPASRGETTDLAVAPERTGTDDIEAPGGGELELPEGMRRVVVACRVVVAGDDMAGVASSLRVVIVSTEDYRRRLEGI